MIIIRHIHLPEKSLLYITQQYIILLVFTRARPKVGPLNYGLRSTKAFDTIPHRRLRATPPGSVRLAHAEVVPEASTRSQTTGHRAGQRAWPVEISQNRQFCTFSPKFCTLRIKISCMFFIRSNLHMTMNGEKFHGNRSTRFLKMQKTDTDRQMRQLYIYMCVCVCVSHVKCRLPGRFLFVGSSTTILLYEYYWECKSIELHTHRSTLSWPINSSLTTTESGWDTSILVQRLLNLSSFTITQISKHSSLYSII